MVPILELSTSWEVKSWGAFSTLVGLAWSLCQTASWSLLISLGCGWSYWYMQVLPRWSDPNWSDKELSVWPDIQPTADGWSPRWSKCQSLRLSGMQGISDEVRDSVSKAGAAILMFEEMERFDEEKLQIWWRVDFGVPQFWDRIPDKSICVFFPGGRGEITHTQLEVADRTPV